MSWVFSPLNKFDHVQSVCVSCLSATFEMGHGTLASQHHRLLERSKALAASPLLRPVPECGDSRLYLRSLIGLTSSDGPLDGFSGRNQQTFMRLTLSKLFPKGPSVKRLDQGRVFGPCHRRVSVLRHNMRPNLPKVMASNANSKGARSFVLPVFTAVTRRTAG